jgi:hypothetical protein
MRRTATVILVIAALAVAAIPALADHAPTTVTVSFAGPVSPGQVITLECPAGYQVRGEAGVHLAFATYYRDPGLHAVVASDVPPDGFMQFSASWTVPRGVRSASATLECVLIDQTQHPTTTSTPPSTTATTTVPTTSTTTTSP